MDDRAADSSAAFFRPAFASTALHQLITIDEKSSISPALRFCIPGLASGVARRSEFSLSVHRLRRGRWRADLAPARPHVVGHVADHVRAGAGS